MSKHRCMTHSGNSVVREFSQACCMHSIALQLGRMRNACIRATWQAGTWRSSSSLVRMVACKVGIAHSPIGSL